MPIAIKNIIDPIIAIIGANFGKQWTIVIQINPIPIAHIAVYNKVFLNCSQFHGLLAILSFKTFSRASGSLGTQRLPVFSLETVVPEGHDVTQCLT